MIIVKSNPSFCEERQYIFDLVFSEIWNVDYKVVYEERCDICIELGDKQLIIEDIFFQQKKKYFLKEESLPKQPLKHWEIGMDNLKKCVVNPVLPIIYGTTLNNNDYMREEDGVIHISIDIFGSAFFMLTRYEECVKSIRDAHDRFSAKNSLAYQESFLNRPIINEYLEILWWSMRRLDPELKRKQHRFQIIPTHDVDKPYFLALRSKFGMVKFLFGSFIHGKKIKTFIQNVKYLYNIRKKGLAGDIYNTFDLIMNISERNGVKSHFYFMTSLDRSIRDGNYDISRHEIIAIIKKILKRGHKIGVHPSYESYLDNKIISQDCNLLKTVLKSNDLEQYNIGGRQHYLRWKAPYTWRYYEEAGLLYDTSVSYADHIGFRCGFCYEYSPYDLLERRKLDLKEYPLIIMECSGLDHKYMNLSREEMLAKALKLKHYCKKYNGNFVILWHNTFFVDAKDVDLYIKIIEN